MGVRRYSRTFEKQERALDLLQRRCDLPYDCFDTTVPTIGEITAAGVATAHWQCRSCWHASTSFALTKFCARGKVDRLRRHYVCGECGTPRPRLVLEFA